MGGFDRSKFKATKVKKLKEQEKEVVQTYNNSDRIPYLKIDPGTNKFRIMPAHPGTASFIYCRAVHWLPREISYEKSGEQITEIKNKPVFNSRVHGNTQKDIVEEYIKFATKVINDDYQDAKEADEKINFLTHWKTGITRKTGWVCYAQKYQNGAKKFGMIEFTNGVKNKMNDLAIVEDVEDVISTDPFTDPDEGKAVIIKYDPNAQQGSDKYKCSLEFRGDYRLSDDELNILLDTDSLEKMLVGCYRKKDFEIALAGLKIYDDKNGFGVFDHSDWEEVVKEISSYYSEDESEDDENKKASNSSYEDNDDLEDEYEDDLEEEDGDMFDLMNRTDLKKFVEENKLGLRFRKSETDKEVRDKIRLAVKSQKIDPLPFEDEVEETSSSKLDDVRSKLGIK